MMQMLSVVDPRFILMVLLGSVAGLFVGAIPGLSVSMATALLVSITYTWEHSDALAMIMGVYVVGVFSGAVSAILINIPGAPSSVVTTLDGYPMSKKVSPTRHSSPQRSTRLSEAYLAFWLWDS